METSLQARPAAEAPAALGVIAAGGADAAAFLQAQLSADVLRLGPGESRLAAWCDAKGRVQAILRVLLRDDEFLLLLPHSLVAPVLQRLRLFVLRSRVSLRDAGEELTVRGVPGENGTEEPEPGRVARTGDRQYLALPGPQPRLLVIAPPHEVRDDETLSEIDWRRADILAGLPQVHPETQGEFVPQMLNLHWLGGIDFDKGCYPGQEVVARLQYRGKLTRRLFRGVLDAAATPRPGTPVADAEGRPQGQVVEAAPGPDGQDLLAVLRIDATEGPLSIDGAGLALAPLPYPTSD